MTGQWEPDDEQHRHTPHGACGHAEGNKANISKHRGHEVNKSLIRGSASTANARLQSPGQGKYPGALTTTISEFQGGDSRSLGRAQGILKADGQASAEHLE